MAEASTSISNRTVLYKVILPNVYRVPEDMDIPSFDTHYSWHKDNIVNLATKSVFEFVNEYLIFEIESALDEYTERVNEKDIVASNRQRDINPFTSWCVKHCRFQWQGGDRSIQVDYFDSVSEISALQLAWMETDNDGDLDIMPRFYYIDIHSESPKDFPLDVKGLKLLSVNSPPRSLVTSHTRLYKVILPNAFRDFGDGHIPPFVTRYSWSKDKIESDAIESISDFVLRTFVDDMEEELEEAINKDDKRKKSKNSLKRALKIKPFTSWCLDHCRFFGNMEKKAIQVDSFTCLSDIKKFQNAWQKSDKEGDLDLIPQFYSIDVGSNTPKDISLDDEFFHDDVEDSNKKTKIKE